MALDDRIDAIFNRPEGLGVTLAMVVMIDGRIVAERYGTHPETPFGPAIPVGADTALISWSTAKSITHAAVGLLVGDGKLDLDAPATVPAWRGTPKERITLLDLLEMRSGSEVRRGLRRRREFALHRNAVRRWRRRPRRLRRCAATRSRARHCLELLVGDDQHHRPHPRAMSSGADAPGMERSFASGCSSPVGMTSAVPEFDDAGTWVGSSYVYATAKDFARFGELYRCDGVAASGVRILPEGWADHGRTFVAHDPVPHDPERTRLRSPLVDVAGVPRLHRRARIRGTVHRRRARSGFDGRSSRQDRRRGSPSPVGAAARADPRRPLERRRLIHAAARTPPPIDDVRVLRRRRARTTRRTACFRPANCRSPHGSRPATNRDRSGSRSSCLRSLPSSTTSSSR